MGNVLLASAPNSAELTDGTVIAGSEASSSYADDNLGNQEPAQLWRSSAMHPQATWIRHHTTAQSLVARSIKADTFALIGHNLRSGSGFYRWLALSGDDGEPNMEALVPTGLVSSSNITGTYTDVDEGYTPDANWIEPTVLGSPWNAVLSFGTPAATPLVGDKLQAFSVYAKASVAGYGFGLTCKLYESGGEVTDLGAKFVTSTTGQWLVWRWDATDLGTADGSAVEIRLSAGASIFGDISIGSVVWQSEDAGDFPSGNLDFDTGWVAYTDSIGTSLGSMLPESAQPQKILFHHESTVHTISSSVYCLISDDHAPVDQDLSASVLDAADGYIQSGVLSVSAGFQPQFNPESFSITFDDESTAGKTLGGQEYGSGGAKRRLYRLALQQIPPSQMVDLAARIDWHKGRRGAILLSGFPDDATLKTVSTAWVTIEEPGPWSAETAGDNQDATVIRWSRDYVLREKL